jgi:hypothetical protein
MPYKRLLGCRQAFGTKNKIEKTRANQFFHIFLSPVFAAALRGYPTDLALANSPISRLATGVVMALGEPQEEAPAHSEWSMARSVAHEGALHFRIL